MVKVVSFTFNAFQENTYILYDETKECIIFDPGCSNAAEKQQLTDFIEQNDLKPVRLINTHCHLDHIYGNKDMADTLVNKVANSGLITIKLDDYYPKQELVEFDLKDYLFQQLILKEKDFRTALKEHDWTQYKDKTLLIDCSTNAIIPIWSYMLVTAYASKYTNQIFQGTKDTYLQTAYSKSLQNTDWSIYEGKPVVIKGCSDKPVPLSAYVELTRLLQPFARSIMYGEPCSTVPIYKRKNK